MKNAVGSKLQSGSEDRQALWRCELERGLSGSSAGQHHTQAQGLAEKRGRVGDAAESAVCSVVVGSA